MDATPNSWANRCLPLAIACQHGWEMLTPVGFTAIWDGGFDGSAVQVTLDDPSHRFVPKGHFGSGSLTFPIEAIYRTAPGVNLYVTGPINCFKDGIGPMSAIIETDWLPYGFTMNWVFTRPNHPVRWDAGEPFCHIFPLPRDLIEQIEPEIRPLESAPQLKADHDAWGASRAAFEAARDQPGSAEQKEGWQKIYYRGRSMPGHRIKLRLKPFTQER